jgi:hypothetical protein
MPQFRNPIALPFPAADEQRVVEKVLGECMHWHWTRSAGEYAQYAICVPCGKRLYLSGNCAPELTDSAVTALWLKLLPRPATDEAVASIVLRKLEAKGWSTRVLQSGGSITCALEKEHVRFESSAQATRAAAINEAAAKAAGHCPA